MVPLTIHNALEKLKATSQTIQQRRGGVRPQDERWIQNAMDILKHLHGYQPDARGARQEAYIHFLHQVLNHKWPIYGHSLRCRFGPVDCRGERVRES